jgi:hypothetical protein
VRSYPIKLALLLFVPVTLTVLCSSSCKKNAGEVTVSPSVVGDWVWVSSVSGGTISMTPASSGIQKKLSFMGNGTLYITHNDSTSHPDALQVAPAPTLLGIEKTVTETATYSTADLPAVCVNIKFPVLLVDGQGGYQYSVSGDTLQISNSTCLAPFSSIYIRSN